ncbi:type IX secretion system sortase PorU [Ekhidna sp. To15]|uniref:type IX secretion system sortase PorU n=1 Tax=Ekhidna sp. To15 TaxID=3395267 RepID=UPI003F520AE3
MRRILPYLFLLGAHVGLSQSSVLSSGTWFKVGITETGIYKIDLNTLSALGVSGGVNPKKIKIYGTGWEGVLPQSNAEERPGDLIENTIFVSGESDNSFDQNDYILFYGIGPDKIDWSDDGFAYEKNFYSDTAYYFINVSGANGKRIDSKPNLGGTPSVTVSTFNDHLTFEEDVINLISSGRGWYGKSLTSGESQTFNYQIDGLASEIDLTLSALNQSSEPAEFNVSTDGNNVGSLAIGAVPDGPGTTYSIKARQEEAVFTLPNTNTFGLEIAFDGNASGERGFIDFYHLTFLRNLRLYNNETDFRWIDNTGEIIRYEVSNASNATVWNVSDPINAVLQEFTTQGNKAIFQSQATETEEFVVYSGSDFPAPFIFGSVPNQSIRSEVNFDGVIVTNPLFKVEAERLAQFHKDHDDLNVQVVTTTEVYNEFSSGRQDVSAIRDYVKHMYETGGRLKYLLLFGDCSYDYKDRVSNNTNYVPTYESRESLHPIFSHSSDDFFGFMEDEEGEWIESVAGDHTLEIGVGRLPAKSEGEAQVMVDKIIYYSTSANTLGKWRGEMTYVADDGDGNIHSRHVEDLSELIDTTFALYNINKVLLDAFTQEASGSSEKSPQASSALKTRIKNGTFLINYIGHGNERLWMEEEILTRSDILELTNRNKLPIFVTATCEFGRYDDPIRVSGAEELLLLEQGGGIALLTTSRPVFASTNFSLNQAFHENIFRKENNKNLRLGDVIRLTKNEGLAGPVNRNFTLLGDPMMMPAFPKLDIVLDDLETNLDTLSALEEVIIAGEIQSNGALKADFNGVISVGVFDVKQTFKTIGQESAPYSYSLRSNALFRGEAIVEGGEFTVSFIVPKNISYQYQNGKMSLYAWDEENNIDAGGSSRSFVIGGTNKDPVDDDTPPTIQAFMNDSSFVNGDQVGASPLLIANIEDESGITTTRSGVVQGITLTLGDQVFNLNDFYSARPNTFREGTVVYPLQDLDPGNYSAVLKVWDTHNNASETTIEFTISDEPILFVYNPIAYPNPVVGSTVFSFEHDREDEDLFVSLLVYSSRGEVVSDLQIQLNNSQRTVEIPWEAQTSTGEALKQGIYYSRLIIQSLLDGATKEIAQKLVIVN